MECSSEESRGLDEQIKKENNRINNAMKNEGGEYHSCYDKTA